MDILTDIRKFIADEKAPMSREWLDEAQEQYPYFSLPVLLYLKRNGVEGNDDLLNRLAIASSDRKSLALCLGTSAELFANFYPEEKLPEATDTDSTINRFLDSFGNGSSKEIEALEIAIFNPTPDYADVLAAQEKEQNETDEARGKELQTLTRDDELINDFIEQSKAKEKQAVGLAPQRHVEDAEVAEIADVPIENPTVQDDSMLSESLAKMYISRRKYSKALEIIENINLKFPEKSVYFADQIRFLRKLVLNEKLKNKN